MSVKVACAQFAPQKAELDRNLTTIAEIIRQAHDEGNELVLLPEASTTGYFLEGGVVEVALTAEQLRNEFAERVTGIERPIDVCLGFYENREGILHNSAAYLEFTAGGVRLRNVYRKFFLPTYGVFDEERFVSRGRDLAVFSTRLGRVAILICEDVWHSILPTLCAVRGAQILLVPAASPGRGFRGERIENHDRYRRLFQAISDEHAMYCLNAQLCGFEGGKGFIGGSMVVNPFGAMVAEAPILEPALLEAEIDLDLVTLARAQSPLISDLQSAWQDIRRMVDSTG